HFTTLFRSVFLSLGKLRINNRMLGATIIITPKPVIKYAVLQPNWLIKAPTIGCAKTPSNPPMADKIPRASPFPLLNHLSIKIGPPITGIKTPPIARRIDSTYQPHTEFITPNKANEPACRIIAINNTIRALYLDNIFPPNGRNNHVTIEEILK